MKVCRHLLDKFRMRAGNIIHFTDIIPQVVEVLASIFITLNQFPVAGPNSPPRKAALITVVGIMPKK